MKRLTLDFGSSHDLTVRETEPRVGLYNEWGACLRFSLSLFLCPSPLLVLSPSLNKEVGGGGGGGGGRRDWDRDSRKDKTRPRAGTGRRRPCACQGERPQKEANPANVCVSDL